MKLAIDFNALSANLTKIVKRNLTIGRRQTTIFGLKI